MASGVGAMIDVSIIIPAYCKTDTSLVWLKECLDSALSQDCEVVLYDDGSIADVESVVRTYAKIGDRLKFVRGSDNRGASAARNAAAEVATRSLILPLDCDDTLVPQAVRKLFAAWHGTPVYPDVAKFGDEVEPHYVLLDFDCQHVMNFVGFTSVNVLHSKEQWAALGGWDNSIKFFEDGEYNARLLGNYCGERFPEPLVNYRIHADQRTKQYEHLAYDYGMALLQKIRRYPMACPGCSKSRRQFDKPAQQSQKSWAAPANRGPENTVVQAGDKNVTLPLEFEGKVLCRYVGNKGAGKHYYRGIITKFPYPVTYGDLVYANPKDTTDTADGKSKLVRVKPTAQAVVPEPKPQPVALKPVETPAPQPIALEPKAAPVRHPVADASAQAVTKAPTVVEELPDLSTMNIKQVFSFIEEATPEQLKKVLKMEAEGLARTKVIQRIKTKLGAQE